MKIKNTLKNLKMASVEKSQFEPDSGMINSSFFITVDLERASYKKAV
jgi:hypothetical protein